MTRKSRDKSPGNTRPLSCSSRMPVSDDRRHVELSDPMSR